MISTHNNTTLSKVPTSSTQPPDKKTCDSRDKNACPLVGNCLTKRIVYRAEITTEDKKETKQYISVTANTFKERFGNHQKSFNNASYANETELLKYVWSLKKSNRPYRIKWSFLNHSSTYVPGGNRGKYTRARDRKSRAPRTRKHARGNKKYLTVNAMSKQTFFSCPKIVCKGMKF